ncbi:MAG: phage regulatory CII family protein [Candidatus Dactylopiibacterium sp.]|nr:phage regulatory CII family protein [Candidatus Dactylopiibacterium sp.]
MSEQQEFDPIIALHADALKYPGGLKALATDTGMAPGTLRNKFCESIPGTEVSARQGVALARLIAAATGAHGFADAVCAQLGGVFVLMPAAGEAADDDVLQELLSSMRALGDMAQELMAARADGVIDAMEFSSFAQRARDVQSRISAVMETVRTQVRELPSPKAFAATSVSLAEVPSRA